MVLKQLRLYLWKTSIQKRRSMCSFCCECLSPVILICLFAWLHSLVHVKVYSTETYECSMDLGSGEIPLQTPHAEVADILALPSFLELQHKQIGVTSKDPNLTASFVQHLKDAYPGLPSSSFSNAGCSKSLYSDDPFPPLINYVRQFKSPGALERYLKSSGYGVTSENKALWAAVVFESGAPEWRYTIRMNSTNVPDTSIAVNKLQRKQDLQFQQMYFHPQPFQTYYNIPGFVPLQLAVDKFILNKQHVNTTLLENAAANLGCDRSAVTSDKNFLSFLKSYTLLPQYVEVSAFPQTHFKHNPFFDLAKAVFSMFFVISFLFPASRLIRGLVLEKETKIREGMRMMGLGDWALFSAWYITYIVMFGFIAILVAIVTSNTMFPNSSGAFLFFYFLFFGIASIAVCFMISSFFSRSKLATTVGTIIFLASFFPYYAVNGDDKSAGQKSLASLSPSVAFALALDVLATVEDNGVGITSATAGNMYNNYTFNTGLFMMLFDAILYTILGWYFDNVIPSEFGVPRKWYFLCTRSYYSPMCKRKKKKKSSDTRGLQMRTLSDGGHTPLLEMEEKADGGDDGMSSDLVEPPEPELRQLARAGRAVAVRGLRKQFDTPDGVKHAVSGVDLTMYEGQIFALLGHNGAGKTTTISMLTGLIPPTSGHATVLGHDIGDDMSAIRHQMGVCPQHDVLWDDLTVEEHLQFFAGLKGVKNKDVDSEVAKIIAEVGLTEKIKVQSSQLSGGQKRKLSVAIALIGGSKVVFLDEPTSGMDPYSRRSTWNILQNAREGRVMILTTHFMDEADLLGDRIAIMADGKVRCCGSSMFLKHKYGVGYHLTLVKRPGEADPRRLEDTIRHHISDCKVLSNVGTEMSFQLPMGASKNFPSLFAKLEADHHDLGLDTYGISVTTLEEVFLKVAEEGDVHERQLTRELTQDLATRRNSSAAGESKDSASQSLLADSAPDATYSRASAVKGDRAFFITHFRALFAKRWRYAKRDNKAVCFQLVIPILALFLGLLLLKLVHISTPPARILSTQKYNDNGDRRLPLELPYWGDDFTETTALMHDVTQRFGKVIPQPLNNLTHDYPEKDYTRCDSYTTEVAKFLGSPNFNVYQSWAMSKHLLATRRTTKASKYGAIILNELMHDGNDALASYAILENTTAPHAAPVFINMMNDAILRHVSGDSGSSITVLSQPFPFTQKQSDVISSGLSLTSVLFVVIAFAFIPASFAVFVVKEREINAKHQQLISGVSIPAYWLSTYCWDIINYSLPCVLSILLILIFNIRQLIEGERVVAMILLFVLYGFAVAPFTYIMTYFFKSHSTAQTIVLLINLFDMILIIAAFVMRLIESTCKVNQVLVYFYRLMPGFALGDGLINLTILDQMKHQYNDCGRWNEEKILSQSYGPFMGIVTGADIGFLAVEGIVYFMIAVGIDVLLSYPAIRAKVFPDKDKKDPPMEVDDDVRAEEERVHSGQADDDLIVLRDIRKVYGGGKVAVRNLAFGIPQGECFGFLGINGAGKTSTLKILSGDVIPTRGTATLNKLDILSQQVEVRRLLGYCPQFDALFELLTTREHLELFARIKGVPKNMVESVVQTKLHEMDLKKFENKTAGSLSGGNKRKLSVAIAMIGDPPIVFLDEPSTGMDPVARRFMWNIIARIATERAQCSIILTTHSMEECEALCSRLGIMVGGRLRCLGSPQHLKTRFGQGYLSEIRLRHPEEEALSGLINRVKPHLNDEDAIPDHKLEAVCRELGDPGRFYEINPQGSGWALAGHLAARNAVDVGEFAEWWLVENFASELQRFMVQTFPGSELVERHGLLLRYKIPRMDDCPLSRIFGLMEENKSRCGISEYSLSQTSLEQIFNLFASQQEEEQGTVRGFARAHSSGRIPSGYGTSNSGAGSGAGAGAGAGAASAAGAIISPRVASVDGSLNP